MGFRFIQPSTGTPTMAASARRHIREQVAGPSRSFREASDRARYLRLISQLPAYWDGAQYRYATGMTCRFLKLAQLGLSDQVVDAARRGSAGGDHSPIDAAQKSRLERLRNSGVAIHFAIDERRIGLLLRRS